MRTCRRSSSTSWAGRRRRGAGRCTSNRWSGADATIRSGHHGAAVGLIGSTGDHRTSEDVAAREPSGSMSRRPGMDRVVDELEPHRPEPGPRFGKVMQGREEARRHHDGGCQPDDHPYCEDPRRGSRRHHDEARDGDGQTDVPHSERPDSRPPVPVAIQVRQFVHAMDCPRMRDAKQGGAQHLAERVTDPVARGTSRLRHEHVRIYVRIASTDATMAMKDAGSTSRGDLQDAPALLLADSCAGGAVI